MSNPSSPLRPAPLSFNSPRNSPFRRPESPARSPSTVRAATPTQGSPLKNSTLSPSTTQSTLRASSPDPTATERSWLTTRGTTKVPSPPSSPTHGRSPRPNPRLSSSTNSLNVDVDEVKAPSPGSATSCGESTSTARAHIGSRQYPLSKPSYVRTPPKPTSRKPDEPLTSIPPQHLHTMRESFTVLDRNSTSLLTPADVAAQLSDLGLDASPATLSTFFPPNTPQSLSLPSYLSLLSKDLAPLSRQQELLDAFAAFDADDEGCVDVGELRAALVELPAAGGERTLSGAEVDAVMEGFVGRRMFRRARGGFGAGGGGGDVFRYGEFVAGIWGGGGQEGKAAG